MLAYLLLLLLIAVVPAQRTQNVVPGSILLMPCEVPGTRPGAKEKALCGSYAVFENRATNRGRKITLKIVVFPATGPRKEADPLFYIPGGPGSSATEEAPFIAAQLAKIRASRAIVYLHPLGTAVTYPLPSDLHNPTDLQSYFGDYFPLDAVRTCRKQLEQKADLKLYTTPVAMDDLDEVREALGHKQINIYAGSYGTRAALDYLKRYSKHVRAVIMQGVSPTDQFMPRDFPQHTERALNGILDECVADAACKAAYPNLRSEVRSVLERLLKGPVAVEMKDPKTGTQAKIQFSRELAAEAIRYMLYQPGAASRIPLFIHLAEEGNYSPLAEVALNYRRRHGTGSNGTGMYLSVTCAEDVPWIKPGEGERNAANTFLGDYRLRHQRAACELWPRANLSKGYREPTRTQVPALIFTGQWDPVTPPFYGDEASKYLPNGLHLVVPYGGHGFGGLDGLDCIEKLTTEFVERGTTRGLDTSCMKNIRRRRFMLKLPEPK